MKKENGHAAFRGKGFDPCTIQPEVIYPAMLAWIIKWSNFLVTFPIYRTEVAPLVTVTLVATEAQVISFRFSTMFPGDDVIYLE